MKSGGSLSIWFFIGVSMLVNGALITGAGVYEVFSPPEHPVVLYQLHAPIWWGASLFVFGALYCYYFAPGRQSVDR